MSSLHPAFAPGEFDLNIVLSKEPPISWRPKEVGDSVFGVVLRMIEGHRGDYSFPILELMQQNGGVVRVRASAVTLRNRIVESGVGVGSIIVITLKGMKISQTGREYRIFDVKVV